LIGASASLRAQTERSPFDADTNAKFGRLLQAPLGLQWSMKRDSAIKRLLGRMDGTKLVRGSGDTIIFSGGRFGSHRASLVTVFFQDKLAAVIVAIKNESASDLRSAYLGVTTEITMKHGPPDYCPVGDVITSTSYLTRVFGGPDSLFMFALSHRMPPTVMTCYWLFKTSIRGIYDGIWLDCDSGYLTVEYTNSELRSRIRGVAGHSGDY
jgi:hypothetical protein